MSTIGVIDYGMGNLHSLAKALETVASQARIEVSPDPAQLAKCDRLVLPGVGGVRACMDELQRLELDDFVVQAARKKPLLGICLGMQVLLEHSRENDGAQALGLIPGEVVRFPDPSEGEPAIKRLKVPHMGWNQVRQLRPHPLWSDIPDNSWFYFVHSYHALPTNREHWLGSSEYGEEFTSAVVRDNIAGFQFHPEKSQALGLRLLANFVGWDGESS